MKSKKHFDDGSFVLGVNYWASHSGTGMWSDWRPEVVEKDFELLSSDGVEAARVFPLLSDFMPITEMYGIRASVREISRGEEFLDPTTVEGRCGIDRECIEKFRFVCKTAEKFGIKLIVPLITGWMSGRCFFPTAFNGKNLLTDPFCIKWEMRFIKYFVDEFKDESAIVAWELGNECNCMGVINDRESAWVWANSVATAVKAVDSSRPVISGMHGLMHGNMWTAEDQGEICDLLTVHPYLAFTPHCNLDPMVSPRAVLHSAAELTMYADTSGRGCLVEEIGSLSGDFGDDETVGLFVRANLFNAWIHNGLGMFWWCAFDQKHLTAAPYDWFATERELGLFRKDGTGKPAAEEYKKFDEFLRGLPFDKLPLRKRDAVCLIDKDGWSSGFGAFMLAKRAGLELQYALKSGSLPDSRLYIVPSNGTSAFMDKRMYDRLLKKVDEGATLLITCGENIISPFEDITGCRSKGKKRSSVCNMRFDGTEISIARTCALDLQAVGAEVLACDQDGVPAFTYKKSGKGGVAFLNAPLEYFFAVTPDVASDIGGGYEKIYLRLKRIAGIKSSAEKTNPLLDVTEHVVDEKKSLFIVMNNTRHTLTDSLLLSGVRVKKILAGNAELCGDVLKVSAPSARAVIFIAEKKD